ncbi:phage terminase large subunit family protein [Wolbachia endosymbiont of Drosophila pseudotakahashii]|uniref:phage terminase large subunit family protein n=1 Tax=Wolbachia endosymbiont of Drosophila pseudotakahashii TaxID=375919 RepID=UPI002231BCEC|nr:phage terminase large subunit family protein [Wolbachia endosymbiont of Drosophila pseudotakahashii]MCX3065196.1 phage terminase large subunit family protein [Wolbachia endosymbiont of Drosophila pseudotakahashii]UZE38215.1 phage terminase large subunit family protein [Wolbachia endosymbiont of Drosophila pseudotakahashii]
MIYSSSFYAGLRPDLPLKVSEWADRNRQLSTIASSEPGKWRTERTPYLKEIMDSLSSSSPAEKVVFMKGAQIGGTEAGNNWIGYIIDQTPGPMLVVQPTVEMGKRWSKGRFAPLIESTPCLKDKVKDPRSRDSGNTVQSKEFPGGIVVITGANSSVGLRSMPVKYLFLDEIDAYPGGSGGEGDPVLLSIARTNTFMRRKIFLVSTPTFHGISRIEREFESSDKRYFFVPCPHCDHYQVLKWPQIKWQDKNPNTAHYVCIECNGKIENHQKTEMLARGEWRPTNPIKGEKKGFHLSSLYSPVGWYSWKQAVEDYLHAKENEQLLKVWINTTLGETWVDKGEVPDWKQLFERRENFPIGTVSKGGKIVLTAGVDVQKDRLEAEIVAWGRNRESWSIDYQVFEGDTGSGEVWGKLSELLNHHFIGENGLEYMISMMAVDAGYATQEVYNWVRSHQGSGRVMAVKGANKALVPLSSPSRVDVTVSGQKLKRGMKPWPVGVSILKSELFQLLNVLKEEEKVPAGYCHFPEYAPEYFKQLTAEQLVSKVVKGYTKQEWQKIRDRNEVLDCRIYARAASIALGIDRWPESKWESLAGEKAKKSKRVRRSQWLSEKS